MAPNEKVTFREQVELALDKHSQSQLFDEKLIVRGSIYGHFAHGGFVWGRMGGQFIRQYWFPQNVEIMKNSI